MKFSKILGATFSAATFLLANQLPAQQISPDILSKPWKTQWITGPGRPINRYRVTSDLTLKEYGVVKFRKTIELKEKPTSFVIHVSEDNRYKLFVNEKQVAQGPARCDLYCWN